MTKTAAIPFQALLGGLFLALGTLIPAASAATLRLTPLPLGGIGKINALFPGTRKGTDGLGAALAYHR